MKHWSIGPLFSGIILSVSLLANGAQATPKYLCSKQGDARKIRVNLDPKDRVTLEIAEKKERYSFATLMNYRSNRPEAVVPMKSYAFQLISPTQAQAKKRPIKSRKGKFEVYLPHGKVNKAKKRARLLYDGSWFHCG